MKQKIQTLQTELSKGLINRDDEIKASLLTMIAGENIVLVGPPGTGKSMVARKMAEALAPMDTDNNYFEYLLTKFSTPEEIFGPLSISELKKDNFVRNTTGYLPTARVAFLDEIFKASSSILNALLTVLNERKYHNGTKTEDIPLQTLVSASNELPNGDESLSALYDRFLVRKMVDYVDSSDMPAFFSLSSSDGVQDKFKLTQSELDDIRERAKAVVFPDNVRQVIMAIWAKHKDVFKEDADEFLSDRKLVKVLGLLRISAVTNGRDEVDFSDVFLLKDCLWNNPDNIVKVRDLIIGEFNKFNNSQFAVANTVSNTLNTQSKNVNLVNVYAPYFPRLSRDRTISEWYFNVGDRVEEGDILANIDSHGYEYKVTAPQDGVLHQIIKDVGDVVHSSELVASIDTQIKNKKSSNNTNDVIKDYQGSGTADDPILIGTAKELIGLQKENIGQKGYYFRQIADIDYRKKGYYSIDFHGHYDGGGFKITNKGDQLYIFDTVGKSTIENLSIIDAGISEKLRTSQIKNCSIFLTSTVHSYYSEIGGICHHAFNSVIENCIVTGSRPDSNNFAGITYHGMSTTIQNCVLGELKDSKYVRLAKFFNEGSDIAINQCFYVSANKNKKIQGEAINPKQLTQFHFEYSLGWDFDNIWEWDNHNNEPILRKKIQSKVIKTNKNIAGYQNPINIAQQLKNNIWL